MSGHKDYSATPLSQKLGAKPGAGVVVFFTTTRAELERRFDALKATLDPADGLWIAWPKQAAGIETDLTFDVVQQTGLAARAWLWCVAARVEHKAARPTNPKLLHSLADKKMEGLCRHQA